LKVHLFTFMACDSSEGRVHFGKQMDNECTQRRMSAKRILQDCPTVKSSHGDLS